ncbi:MAG TPA: hypothetical protein VIJ29_04045 [Candidatus Paceibacterota bacterium]
MFIISEQQAGQRWDVLTPALREALFSDVNGNFVWKLCEDNHLPKEKCYQVGELAGYVLYGFIHPEDLSGELVKSLSLPAPLAKTISDAINARVFAPLKADLDKVYSPLISTQSSAQVTAPKIIQNTGTMPKPTILSDVGWSKTLPSMMKPGLAPISPAVPAAPKIPTPMPQISTPSPVAPTKPAEPAPVMLHEDTSFKAVEKNAGFTLSRPTAGAEMRMAQGTAQAPSRPAVLEFGGAKPPVPNKPSTTPPSPGGADRVDFRSPLSAIPTANTGPRSVSQITPSAPVPPSAPRPPAPPQGVVPLPRPPQPPQAPTSPQADKPIVKDFL